MESKDPIFAADRDFVARFYIEVMGARFDGVDGRRRSHASRSCGSGRESGLGGAEVPKRGVEPAWEGRCVRGLAARGRASCSTHVPRLARSEWMRRVSSLAVSQPRFEVHTSKLERACLRAIRRKASRCRRHEP